VPIPEAPDGLAVIRWDEGGGTFLQHYFDASDFDFSQRFTGRFSEDGRRIDGTFEIAHDHETWEKDFDAVYTRV
jgi:hypothetical protein